MEVKEFVKEYADCFELKFEKPPKIKTREEAIQLLDLLIKAEGVINDIFALKAIRSAIKKGIA
jgi:hypothetical protein